MLTQGEDVEVHALTRRGWSVSAIARHLGRDRKTVRAYLTGERQPGRRASARPDPLAPFAAYLAARFTDDPHIWATAPMTARRVVMVAGSASAHLVEGGEYVGGSH